MVMEQLEFVFPPAPRNPSIPFDPYCNRTPSEISEYWDKAHDSGLTINDYVRQNEGTYNPVNGHFACTECYIKLGMPSSRSGWKAD